MPRARMPRTIIARLQPLPVDEPSVDPEASVAGGVMSGVPVSSATSPLGVGVGAAGVRELCHGSAAQASIYEAKAQGLPSCESAVVLASLKDRKTRRIRQIPQ